ncbi:uncharacterized protein [Epargyreus clarus]|uniref:uncharacterized protein n=1 Tax=Epargyreus clarus TaxID=520877 RepID=UPI003C2E9D37
MYKLVVLSFLAVAVAEPGALLTPYAFSSTLVSPATTTITKQASSVVHPSPFFYQAPLAYTHFIKKRSVALSPYFAPTTYISSPLATTYSAPWIHASSILPTTHLGTPLAYTTAHLIKKRSAPFVYPATYIAPTTYTTTPLVASTYAAAPIFRTPLIASPFNYAHLIKKRSAVTAYVAPASYSSQSRIDYHGAPVVSTYASYHPLGSYPALHSPVIFA